MKDSRYHRFADDVKLGKHVIIHDFVNLHGRESERRT